MGAFRGGLLVGMWHNENLLKLAQVKHRICHTHGNDIKLVCTMVPPALPKCETLAPPSELGPERSVLGARAAQASYLFLRHL